MHSCSILDIVWKKIGTDPYIAKKNGGKWMQETEKWTTNHFTFYILGEVSDWMRYMQILQEPGKILHN